MAFAQAIMESVASSMFHSPPRAYLFFLVVGLVASLAWRRRLGEREGAPS
jgi:MYXO-CTERM domain-containing protein